MSGESYIQGTDHARTVASALAEFHAALTGRWQEQVVAALIDNRRDFPTAFRRAVSPHNYQSPWECWSIPTRHHLTSIDGCAYLAWFEAGGRGTPTGVKCDGATDADEPAEVLDPDSGVLVTVPTHIDCGVGRLLEQVEDWAWGERDNVFYHVPMFDHHDVDAIRTAYEALIRVGKSLKLEVRASDSGTTDDDAAAAGDRERGSDREDQESGSDREDTSVDAVGIRDIPTDVKTISSGIDGSGWYTAWTGLAAEYFTSGFSASMEPTLTNQSLIIGALAELYASRATIIEKARNDTLYWIQWATRSLTEEHAVPTDHVPGWKAVQGVGMGMTLVGFLATPFAVGGAAVTLGGFLLEYFLPTTNTEEHKYELEDIVSELNSRINELNRTVADLEIDYLEGATRLRGAIRDVHSYNLELYDLTRNDPRGDQGTDGYPLPGFKADVSVILTTAHTCLIVGNRYAMLLPDIAEVRLADRHLAGSDGRQTMADETVLTVRDLLDGFLRTTAGRYLVAGEQVRAAAEAYARTDYEVMLDFQDAMDSWKVSGEGVDFDPHEYARETDRPGPDPHQPPDPDRPVDGPDGDAYVTEDEEW